MSTLGQFHDSNPDHRNASDVAKGGASRIRKQFSRMKKNPSIKVKVRRARCKQVLAILVNRLETVELIRQEVHPPVGDFAEGPLELAVVRWNGLEVYLALKCVVFLGKQPRAERANECGLSNPAATGMCISAGKQKRQPR